jgi:hypothetical protein
MKLQELSLHTNVEADPQGRGVMFDLQASLNNLELALLSDAIDSFVKTHPYGAALEPLHKQLIALRDKYVKVKQ